MKWYWILLIIYAYIVIGAVIAGLVVGTDDDTFLAIVILWPLAIVLFLLAFPIKLIFNIFNIH